MDKEESKIDKIKKKAPRLVSKLTVSLALLLAVAHSRAQNNQILKEWQAEDKAPTEVPWLNSHPTDKVQIVELPLAPNTASSSEIEENGLSMREQINLSFGEFQRNMFQNINSIHKQLRYNERPARVSSVLRKEIDNYKGVVPKAFCLYVLTQAMQKSISPDNDISGNYINQFCDFITKSPQKYSMQSTTSFLKGVRDYFGDKFDCCFDMANVCNDLPKFFEIEENIDKEIAQRDNSYKVDEKSYLVFLQRSASSYHAVYMFKDNVGLLHLRGFNNQSKVDGKIVDGKVDNSQVIDYFRTATGYKKAVVADVFAGFKSQAYKDYNVVYSVENTDMAENSPDSREMKKDAWRATNGDYRVALNGSTPRSRGSQRSSKYKKGQTPRYNARANGGRT